MKKCTYCDKKKKKSEFFKDKFSPDKLSYKCKSCFNTYASTKREAIKGHKLKYRYNMSMEEYNNLLNKQNNVCAGCKGTNKNRNLSVDHCHKTGKVRGLLCIKCNSILGYVNDEIYILKNLTKYLNKYKNEKY